MREIAKSGAAPFLFDCDAKKTKRPKLRPQIARKTVGPVDLVGARRNLLLREVADRVAKYFDIAAKTEIEAGQAIRQHRSRPGDLPQKVDLKNNGADPRHKARSNGLIAARKPRIHQIY